MTDNLDETTEARLADAARKNTVVEQAQTALKKAIDEGKVVVDDIEKGRYVAFVAPVEKNTRFLIKAGKPVSFADKDSPRGQKMVGRDGDLWVEFHDGILVLDTDDETDCLKVLWCVEHKAVCRDANDPLTEAWLVLKEGQSPLAWRDAVISQSMDVDKALQGDPAGFSRAGSAAERARKHVAEANASA